MSYVGWMILAYRYYHDKPEQQAPISKEELANSVRQSFQSPEWSIAEYRDRLMYRHNLKSKQLFLKNVSELLGLHHYRSRCDL